MQSDKFHNNYVIHIFLNAKTTYACTVTEITTHTGQSNHLFFAVIYTTSPVPLATGASTWQSPFSQSLLQLYLFNQGDVAFLGCSSFQVCLNRTGCSCQSLHIFMDTFQGHYKMVPMAPVTSDSSLDSTSSSEL